MTNKLECPHCSGVIESYVAPYKNGLWHAVCDSWDLGFPVGEGKTAEEAIDDYVRGLKDADMLPCESNYFDDATDAAYDAWNNDR